jgi:hypothetical protein
VRFSRNNSLENVPEKVTGTDGVQGDKPGVYLQNRSSQPHNLPGSTDYFVLNLSKLLNSSDCISAVVANTRKRV